MLQHETEADSMTEVIRRSLAVYEMLWNAQQEGETVLLRDTDGNEREVVLIP